MKLIRETKRLFRQQPMLGLGKLILLALCLCLAESGLAQENDRFPLEIDSAATYQVKRFDGVLYYGKIVTLGAEELVLFIPKRGNTLIPLNLIASIKKIPDARFDEEGVYHKPKSAPVHTIFNTTFTGLKQGEVESGLSLLGPDVILGISERKTLRLSTSWILSPLMLTYTYRQPMSEKLTVAFGIMGGWGTYTEYSATAIMPYAGFTYGSTRKNISACIGYGYYQGFAYYSMYPYFAVSSGYPLSKKWSLIYDSYLIQLSGVTTNTEGSIPHTVIQGMAALAARYQISEGRHFQFGAGAIALFEETYPLPIIQYFRTF